MVTEESVLNKLFDEIYVISLADCLERREHIGSTLTRKGVKFTFINAVDGRSKAFGDTEWNRLFSLSNRFMPTSRELKSAEVGCALSHNSIYKKMIQDNVSTALILEDDVDMTLPKVISDISDDILKVEWDLLYFGVKNNRAVESNSFKLKRLLYYPIIRRFFRHKRSAMFNAKEIARIHPRQLNKSLMYAGCHHGTHAYAVTNAGAKKVLDFNYPVRLPSDLALNELIVRGQLTAFLLKENMFVPRPEAGSTIGNPVSSSRR